MSKNRQISHKEEFKINYMETSLSKGWYMTLYP